MSSPEPQAVDMRHTKLRPEEAALIAGEIVKPSWASRNEGIHERVSFEDTLWGFEMAGGAYYKTPLRITYVKPGSRAEQACIRMGDTVLRIQGIDTSTLTLQEAHQLVHEAGINLKIAVTSPDDEHDAHYVYQDPLMERGGLTAEQLRALERERIQRAIAKSVRCRDLEWPWVRRKFIIYRESNCFMVPSKYENQHREKYPELPAQKIAYFFPMEKQEKVKPVSNKNTEKTPEIKEPVQNGDVHLEEEQRVTKEEEQYETEDEEQYVAEEEEGLEENQEPEVREESVERLEEETLPEESVEEDEQKHILDNIAEIENESSEQNEDETVDTIRKDSEGSSVIELDNNNNHVSKNKHSENLVDSENIENEVDEMIDELAGDENKLIPNDMKSDDEVIDSVLNGDGDTQNER